MKSRLITLEIVFPIGSVVFLKTDPDQHARLVKGFWVDSDDGDRLCISYNLGFGTYASWHIELEMSTVKNVWQLQNEEEEQYNA